MSKRTVEPYGMVSVYDTLHHCLNFFEIEGKTEDLYKNRKREIPMYHFCAVYFPRFHAQVSALGKGLTG